MSFPVPTDVPDVVGTGSPAGLPPSPPVFLPDGVATVPGAETSPVDPADIERLRRLLVPLAELRGAERLTGGFFATTYAATLADGSRVVVKTAPVDGDRLLTYERDLVRSEAAVYGIGLGRPDLLMPRLLLTDFSRTLFAGDVVVAEYLPGIPWNQAGFGPVNADARAARAQRELGALMARLHTVTGPRFGYVGAGSGLVGATWPQAFGRIVAALLADGRRWSVPLPGAEIRAALEAHHDALAAVTTPVLVHHDLWPGNVFVDPDTGELLGVIDPERALWGDPLLDLLGADQAGHGPIAPAGLLDGYAAQAGARWDVTSAASGTRLNLYRMLWGLIWLVEAKPRGYAGDFARWYQRTASGNLRAALDRLAWRRSAPVPAGIPDAE